MKHNNETSECRINLRYATIKCNMRTRPWTLNVHGNGSAIDFYLLLTWLMVHVSAINVGSANVWRHFIFVLFRCASCRRQRKIEPQIGSEYKWKCCDRFKQQLMTGLAIRAAGESCLWFRWIVARTERRHDRQANHSHRAHTVVIDRQSLGFSAASEAVAPLPAVKHTDARQSSLCRLYYLTDVNGFTSHAASRSTGRNHSSETRLINNKKLHFQEIQCISAWVSFVWTNL